jgi:uroporphyrinogen-III synthase
MTSEIPAAEIREDDALAGECVLVTRPLPQSKKLVLELRAHGARVEELPLIAICAPESWEPFDRAFARLDSYAWLLFASANAVESTLARAAHLNLYEKIKSRKIACIGPATARALLDGGLSASLTPAAAVAESLLEQFPPAPTDGLPSDRRLLWPRTNIGRTIIKDELSRLGWQVEIVHSYRTEGPQDPLASAKRLEDLLSSKQLTAIMLTSSETARRLGELLLLAAGQDSRQAQALVEQVKLCVIGPETAETCRLLFGRVDVQASEFSGHGLVEALIKSC